MLDSPHPNADPQPPTSVEVLELRALRIEVERLRERCEAFRALVAEDERFRSARR